MYTHTYYHIQLQNVRVKSISLALSPNAPLKLSCAQTNPVAPKPTTYPPFSFQKSDVLA